MHALHFPTTFQIQMDVPCSRLYSLLPPLPSCLCCNSALFVVDPISRFDPYCGVEADCGAAGWLTDRQTQRHINKLAWMPLLCPLLCPPTPSRVWTHHSPPPCAKPSSLSLRLQTRTHTHIHYPSCSSTTPFTVWSAERESEAHPLSHWFAVTGWAAEHPQQLHIFRSLVTYGQEQTWEIHHVRKAEATLWRATVEGEAGDLAWQLIHLSECIMTEGLDPSPESVFGNHKWLFNFVRLNTVIRVCCCSYQSLSAWLSQSCYCCSSSWWWHINVLHNYITLCNQGRGVWGIRTQWLCNTKRWSMRKSMDYGKWGWPSWLVF